MPTHKTAIQ